MLFLACWLIPEEKYVYASSLKANAKIPLIPHSLKNKEESLM